MVDFEKHREASLSDHYRTGGAASSGVTVRDYFAARIASAMYTEIYTRYSDWDHESIASAAYAFADFMMKERDRKPQEQCSVEEAFGL